MTDRKPCIYCGRVHAVASVCVSVLAANSNFPIVNKNAVRKRLTAQEAMARTKKQFKGTLDYLA